MPYVEPQFSKSRVNRAAKGFLAKQYIDPNDGRSNLAVVENWRAAHAHIINSFQAMLRNRARGKPILIAQRHKRRSTIFDKLSRHDGMLLARMHDIAGCRLIFEDEEQLYEFRHDLNQNNRFRHELTNEPDQYDYIKCPKTTGYRGVHDVYRYRARTAGGRPWDGLLVEIQYRTLPQHAWATAVEIAGNITAHQPKFDRADQAVMDFFRLASEVIARYSEARTSLYSTLSSAEVVKSFEATEKSIGLLESLRHLRPITEHISKRGNFVMYIDQDGIFHAEAFESQVLAIRRLFELEQRSGESPVMARADNIEALKTAYRNYFSDANDFVALVDQGLAALKE